VSKIALLEPHVQNQNAVCLACGEGKFMIKIEADFSGLEQLERNLEKLDGEQEVKATDLLPDSFIRENTNFQTLDAFLDAGGIKSQEDMSTDAFDDFVAANTRFANWQEMFKAAGVEWGQRQLFAGLKQSRK
jgi:hypothetical protein